MPRYYQYAGTGPKYLYHQYQRGPALRAFRGAETRGLGDIDNGILASQNPGTYFDGFIESQYDLQKGRGPFYAMHPWNGAPEPLSPQAYPAQQAAVLGAWDTPTTLAVVAAGTIAAYLLVKTLKKR